MSELSEIVFKLINFTNTYILVLDEESNIKFANNSLAIRLGFESYNDLLGRCWLGFLEENSIEHMKIIYKTIAYGKNWEKYKEFKTKIKDTPIEISWFNSHINTDYNWVFSFGVQQEITKNKTMDFIRNYYNEIVNNDRVMIEAIKDKINSGPVKSCEYHI